MRAAAAVMRSIKAVALSKALLPWLASQTTMTQSTRFGMGSFLWTSVTST